jgi:hypothetical protein
LSDRHYLDHASTSLVRPEVAMAMSNWLADKRVGDPGRVHAEGQAARDAIETARAESVWVSRRLCSLEVRMEHGKSEPRTEEVSV